MENKSLIAAKQRLLKAKVAVAYEKDKDARRQRKERDTALFTIGAVFLAAFESGDDAAKHALLKVWNTYALPFAPQILTDNRRLAISKTAYKP